MILNYAGNHLLHYITTVMHKRVFYPMTRVTSVTLMTNGDIVTNAIRKQVEIKIITNNQGRLDYRVVPLSETTVTFRSKAVVISHGGYMVIHPEFFNWFPKLQSRKDRVMMADEFLKKEVYLETMRKIRPEGIKKIVIIGGSHSGFAAAQMLLEGPADLWHNTHVKPSCAKGFKSGDIPQFPGAPLKKVHNCSECCTCRFNKGSSPSKVSKKIDPKPTKPVEKP
jgi:hypothetical protein